MQAAGDVLARDRVFRDQRHDMVNVVCLARLRRQSVLALIHGALSLGVERKAGKYYLLLPKGMKRIPAHNPDTTRPEALLPPSSERLPEN